MIFSSIEFAIFLPIVFALYWVIANKSLLLRNSLLLLTSYIFYGWWDWRFLLLIVVSSFIDFSTGLAISNSKQQRHKNLFLVVSLIANLGLLFFFKYYNFFAQELSTGLISLGLQCNIRTLNIILPIGISFYTFQTLSYTIDVYKGEIKATNNLIGFFAFVSFFPQLVAGPIERASHLLPQFFQKKSFSYQLAKQGTWLILWGLFKKVVIADNCAPIVDEIFSNFHSYSGSTLWLGAILFAFQIYGDFSGYSDIAIGTASLFGFSLMTNFYYPYFAENIADFWKRWHISLSSWFRDYVYIPIGGSRVNLSKKIRNLMVVFIISGFWHGANWTFLVWGAFHALLYLPLYLCRNHFAVKPHGSNASSLLSMLLTFTCVTIGWVFFRSECITDAFSYIYLMISKLHLSPGQFFLLLKPSSLFFIVFMILNEWIMYKVSTGWKSKFLDYLTNYIFVRYFYYLFIAISIVLFYPNEATSFIYFQF